MRSVDMDTTRIDLVNQTIVYMKTFVLNQI